jgi:hypothetical protein
MSSGRSHEKIYVKITNKEECHNGFQYQPGLNILQEPFQVEGSCVPGGFYYTDLENIHYFYDYGIWLWIVEIPDDAQVVEDPHKTFGQKWRTDKIILSQKYSLYDVETVKKFNLKITDEYIKLAIHSSDTIINLLQWLIDTKDQTFLQLQYTTHILDSASRYGYANLLEWWINSGLPVNCSIYYALCLASINGHANVLESWLKSNLPLKYDEYALDKASESGHTNVLDWWFGSGLELKYSKNALDLASKMGHLDVLDWWLKSDLPFKYSENALDKASESGHTNVLDWWFGSGLELKYTKNALEWASRQGKVEVLDLWLKSNLPLKYTKDLFSQSKSNPSRHYYPNEVLEWWKNSGLDLDL